MTDENGTPFGELGTRDELRAATLALLSSARRTVHIYSRDMDPQIYDDSEFLDALTRFAVAHNQAQVRVIVQDAGPAIRSSHRLIGLAQRLSSRIAIREPGPQHREYNAAFFVTDAQGVIYRELGDRFDAVAAEDDRPRARQLIRYHDEVWEFGRTNPNLRVLGI